MHRQGKVPSYTTELAPSLKRLLERRQVVEPMIGHMKADGLLDRNWIKGELGDALHAVMCGAGHNLRMILARLRALYCVLIAVLAIRHHDPRPYERGEAEQGGPMGISNRQPVRPADVCRPGRGEAGAVR